MKKAALIVLALAVMTTLAARAQGAAPREGRPEPPRMSGGTGPEGGPEGPDPEGQAPPPRGSTPFERDFFPPEMVLRNQIAIGLTPEQVDSLKKLINETHAKVLDLQTELERITEQFKSTLVPSRVDEAAALAQADRMLNLEVQVKRAQLTLLVRVKNLLTEKQQEKLRELRRPRREPDER